MAEPPLRLVVGDDAYIAIHGALRDRLRALSKDRESSGPIPDAI
jgi:hypothetical protein